MTAITGIDHTLIGVRDLEAARTVWTRLGFAPCPRGRHIGWGTANYCIMFPDDYIELLGIVDPNQFTNNLDRFLEEREGLLGLAFAVSDPLAASEEIPGAETPKDLKRILEAPDGDQLPEFSLVHYPPETTPGLRSFICHHRTPGVVWRPEWLEHPNGISGLLGVVAAVEDPAALLPAYERLFGPGALRQGTGWLEVDSGRGQLRFLDRQAFADRCAGLQPPCAGLPCLAVMRLASGDLNATRRYLSNAGVPFREKDGGALLIAPEQANGTILEIEAA